MGGEEKETTGILGAARVLTCLFKWQQANLKHYSLTIPQPDILKLWPGGLRNTETYSEPFFSAF